MAFAGFLRQSTAVNLLIGKFVSSDDAVTPMTTLTLDVELSKNGATKANKNEGTTPTHDSGGDIDGYYICALDATDTNTLGVLTLMAKGTDALEVRMDYLVVTANWWDSMCASDYLETSLSHDTVAEMSQGVPPSAPTVIEILNYLYRQLVNKVETTDTSTKVYDAASTTVLFESALNFASNTFTKNKTASGS